MTTNLGKTPTGKAVPPRAKACDDGESQGELLAKLANHRDLLARILKPFCYGTDAALRTSERRLVDRLLSESEDLVHRLERTLPGDAGRQ